MKTPYDASFDPAAPVLSVTLTGVVHRRPRLSFPALIDTGSDVTAIPQTAVQRLKLYAVGRIPMEDLQAQVTQLDLFVVQVTFAEYPPQEMEVIPTELPLVVLGRDWLQSYYLLLNGPEQTLEISSAPLPSL